jgi:hypothetical protein
MLHRRTIRLQRFRETLELEVQITLQWIRVQPVRVWPPIVTFAQTIQQGRAKCIDIWGGWLDDVL